MLALNAGFLAPFASALAVLSRYILASERRDGEPETILGTSMSTVDITVASPGVGEEAAKRSPAEGSAVRAAARWTVRLRDLKGLGAAAFESATPVVEDVVAAGADPAARP